jgi:hypothetical protein
LINRTSSSAVGQANGIQRGATSLVSKARLSDSADCAERHAETLAISSVGGAVVIT